MIGEVEVNDTRMYHCHNRMDESPFTISKTENDNDKSKKKTWIEFVKTIPSYPEDTLYGQRCLGSRADKVIHRTCKFFGFLSALLMKKVL